MKKEVNKPRSEFLSALDKYDKTTALSYLSVLLIVLACIAVLMSFMAVDASKEAKIQVNSQDNEIAELKRQYNNRVDTLSLQISLLEADMRAHGIKITPLEEE